ncbi:hypothetical protein IFM89_036889 [Coptis chinensis]|uniref:6-phosphogluconate dehydrogenase NADP-binding domain-containing protein n=1 Tax=Coptis chinensis TaxID=261450 RepID=A0A835I0K7_9MAGN|nr:hypothetical protein IFM89_036889 [Coptis chinensis]
MFFVRVTKLQLLEDLQDKDGVLEQIGEGKCYIDMSTVDADTSSKISEVRLALSMQYFICYPQAITKKGGYFLEAPVSGSKKPAEDGQLVILAAGE